MEIQLGRFPAQFEQPEPVKFAWPILLLPELFTTTRHLRPLAGYLATIGWEVYSVDLRGAAGQYPTPALSRLGFDDFLALAAEVLGAIGRDSVVLGHGIGGLIALKLAERAGVKAAVAYAPPVPGFTSPLTAGFANRIAAWRGGPLRPPTGRTLAQFVAGAEPLMRDAIIRALVPDSLALPSEIARGEIKFQAVAAPPRLVVAGDSDIFAPLEKMRAWAEPLSAALAVVPGRGHWLIGGRALERAIRETQRFLVRALGRDLLLLYEERPPEES
ncbi:MAG TPA: alpha/beta fold hydrolase [Candidatus Binataceae bacterium]|nr:alpha/beta fold hydrolase [Candidatus Binataceae bacterium]